MSSLFPHTLRSSLRSETSNKVRLEMSFTSCWILGEYCLGAPSNAGVAMASEGATLLVLRSLSEHRAGVCCWSCCLENEKEWAQRLTVSVLLLDNFCSDVSPPRYVHYDHAKKGLTSVIEKLAIWYLAEGSDFQLLSHSPQTKCLGGFFLYDLQD